MNDIPVINGEVLNALAALLGEPLESFDPDADLIEQVVDSIRITKVAGLMCSGVRNGRPSQRLDSDLQQELSSVAGTERCRHRNMYVLRNYPFCHLECCVVKRADQPRRARRPRVHRLDGECL